MNWLVTGGCGFIGHNLISRVLQEGHSVRVLDNLSAGTRGNLERAGKFTEYEPIQLPDIQRAGEIQLAVADVRDFQAVSYCAKGMDVIVHLAANTGVQPSIQDPLLDLQANVLGTFHCLEGARSHGVKKFIFASTGAVLGQQEPPLVEGMCARPISPYGASKLSGEAYCSAFGNSYGIATVALRFSNVYGPGSAHKESVIAKFIKMAVSEGRIFINGDGEQTRDFIHVLDLCEAIFRAQQLKGEAAVLQLGMGKETTINRLSQLLKKYSTEILKKDLQIQYREPLPGDVRRSFADITKARNLLTWKPFIELEAGLEMTLRWYLESDQL